MVNKWLRNQLEQEHEVMQALKILEACGFFQYLEYDAKMVDVNKLTTTTIEEIMADYKYARRLNASIKSALNEYAVKLETVENKE